MKEDNENKIGRYETEPIADGYIHSFMESVKWLKLDSIHGSKLKEIIDNYKDNVALNHGLTKNEVTRGINEIGLSIDIYNALNDRVKRN